MTRQRLITHLDSLTLPLDDVDTARAADELHATYGTWDPDQIPGNGLTAALRRHDRQVPWEYRRDMSYPPAIDDYMEGLLAAQAAVEEATRVQQERIAARDALIWRAHGKGASVARLADALGMTGPGVRKALARVEDRARDEADRME